MPQGTRTNRLTKELEALRAKDGKIYPRQCVDWAKSHKSSALYSYLEWDDAAAADEYRIDQVRNLIQVHLIDPLGGRRFISLSIDRTSGGGYRPAPEILKRPSLRSIMLNDALDDLERLQRLYRALEELEPFWEILQRLRGRNAA